MQKLMKLERFIWKTKVSSGTKYNKLITYIIVLADIKLQDISKSVYIH